MKNLARLMWFVVLLTFGAATSLAQGNSLVRFVHVVPNVGAVDVFLNGTLAVETLAFGNASTYLTVPSGQHTVSVTASGTSTPLWQQSMSADAGRATTLIASSANTPQFTAFSDNLTTTGFGSGRLLLIHAVEGAPPVDVKLARSVTLGGVEQPVGTTIASGMAYNTSFGAFDLPAQNYVVNVVASGSEAPVLSEVSVPLPSGTSQMAVVYGTPAQPAVLLLNRATQPNADSGLVRFVHGIIGAGNVDILVNNTLLVPNLSARTASEHIALPAGEHTVKVVVAGSDGELAQAALVVAAGQAQTLVVQEAAGAAVLVTVTDDLSGVNADTAALTVTNTIVGGEVSRVQLGSTTLANSLQAGNSAPAVTLRPQNGSISFTLTISGQSGTLSTASQPFYGGVYYNIIAVAGDGLFTPPTMLVLPTSLAQTVGSAPSAATRSISTTAAQPPAASEVVTAAPPAPVVQQPSTASTGNEITASVVLNPGANLQLRQYPSATSLSLGLAPSGSVLIVRGREGRPIALVEGQSPPPEAETWVDPVTLLEDERADLDPAQTWLRVVYNTPDGGTITAWANAQPLDVRNAKGERQKLRDLDTVGGNIPGRAESTAITPPPVTQDTLTAVVININPGANLNIRRYPNADSEVIGKIPVNTVLVFVGMVETDDWAFIEYATPEGGTIVGWVSTQYLRYEYNGRVYQLEDFKNIISRSTSQALFEIIPATRPGEVLGNVRPVTVATPSPLRDAFVAVVQLDPTANLQLRRYPDATSESLNLIPSGTQLVVTARTEAADWLRVTFEGSTGWVAAPFVRVTYNGRVVDLTEIPLAEN